MLEGKKVKLRALEPTDIDLLYSWENNESNWQVGNTIVPFSRQILTDYIANAHLDIFTTKQLRLVIDNENKTAVGLIDLFDYDPLHLRAGIGILIAGKSEQNKGYATEAVNLLVNYSFSVLNLHQLYCHIGIENKASLHLFEKCGFKQVAVLKDWIRTNNCWNDVCVFQLINK